MPRINVYAHGDQAIEMQYDGKSTLLGWFNSESCTNVVAEGTRWNGNNHVGAISRLQIGYEELLRTRKGQWVRHYDSRNEFNGPEYYEFITNEQAREWLMRSENDNAEAVLERYFGEPEEEAGPDLGGRPKVGTKVEVRLPAEVLAQVDERAATENVSRAEMIRKLVTAGL